MCIGKKMCKGCSGPNCMADGGQVDKSPPAPNPDPTGYAAAGQSLQTDKDNPVLKSIQGAFGKAEGGEVEQDHKDFWAEHEHQKRSGNMEKSHEAKVKMLGLEAKNPALAGKSSEYGKSEYGENYSKGGEVDDDAEMHDMVGKEMMDAVHSKDHKAFMEGLESMILSHMSKR